MRLINLVTDSELSIQFTLEPHKWTELKVIKEGPEKTPKDEVKCQIK